MTRSEAHLIREFLSALDGELSHGDYHAPDDPPEEVLEEYDETPGEYFDNQARRIQEVMLLRSRLEKKVNETLKEEKTKS